MDQKEKLTELSVKLKKLKENASILNKFEMAKRLEEIKLEMSQLEATDISSMLDNIENNMKERADQTLNKIIVTNDSKIGTKAPEAHQHRIERKDLQLCTDCTQSFRKSTKEC